MDRDMNKPGSSAHFPKRIGCMPWFFRMSAGTKLNCAFNNSGLNSKKKLNFAFFKGYISARGISAILIINAPKSSGAREMEILKYCNVFEYGGAFRLTLAHCKKNNKIKKQILKCLPNLWDTLIKVQRSSK